LYTNQPAICIAFRYHLYRIPPFEKGDWTVVTVLGESNERDDGEGSDGGGFGPNTGCIERITIPDYPPLDKQARIDGTIYAHVPRFIDGISANDQGCVYKREQLERAKSMCRSRCEDAIQMRQESKTLRSLRF
jgi:hypothetical protein